MAESEAAFEPEAEPEPEADEEADDELTLKPSTMRGSETMYGYLVALELVVVSVLNLTDTHGAGAPSGPQRLLGANISAHSLSVFGLAVSIALFGIVYWVRHRFVVASKDLAKAEGRSGWKVMPYDTGVDAEVIAGDPRSAATQRLTVTRMVGLGEFSPATPRRRKGGSKPTAVLAIANEAGQFVGVTFDAASAAGAKTLGDVLNHRAGAYRQPTPE